MCRGSEAGSYFRLIDFVYHSTLGLRVIKKRKKNQLVFGEVECVERDLIQAHHGLFLS